MSKMFTFQMEEDTVRFTPDGKISILDAIKAVSDSDHPEEIWKRLMSEDPAILAYCNHYSFREEDLPVIDSEGWDILQMMLFDYILEHER